jgi:hypothetical protein
MRTWLAWSSRPSSSGRTVPEPVRPAQMLEYSAQSNSAGKCPPCAPSPMQAPLPALLTERYHNVHIIWCSLRAKALRQKLAWQTVLVDGPQSPCSPREGSLSDWSH